MNPINQSMTVDSRHTQKGAALIVSLLFLLIMTIVGITAMQVATLEERMSGNMRARSLAFQAAESALRAAEAALGQALDNNNLLAFTCANGYYRLNDLDCDGVQDLKPIWNTVDWTSNAQVISGPALPNASTLSAYIVEFSHIDTGFDQGVSEANKQNCNAASGCICYYRVTARGAGSTSSAVAIVQSFYTHLAIPIAGIWRC